MVGEWTVTVQVSQKLFTSSMHRYGLREIRALVSKGLASIESFFLCAVATMLSFIGSRCAANWCLWSGQIDVEQA
jgi:hypothetical protein